MELKKDGNAVSIDMLLIVHSEKRRAAQGTHSDPQADPGALPQRRGGNARPARAPGPRTSASSPRGPPAGGAPQAPPNEISETDPLPAAACASAPWHRRPVATRSPVIALGLTPCVGWSVLPSAPRGATFLPVTL